MATESHRMEVVAAAKHSRKAIVWEVFGLLVVLAIGAAALFVIGSAIANRYAELELAKRLLASETPPEIAPVDVKSVERLEIRDSIRLPGLIAANLTVKTPIEVSGQVTERFVDNGQAVRKGQPLLAIDDRDYKIDLQRAEATLKNARARYERSSALAGKGAATVSEMDAAEAEMRTAEANHSAAKLALERCVVISPADGEVASIEPEPGEWLKAGDIVATLVDIAKVKIEVGIPEKDVDPVRRLETCEIFVDSIRGGHSFTAKKTYLSLTPVSGTQVYKLELEAANSDRLLLPGMFVDADVVRDVRHNSTMVMAFAVMTVPGGYEVAVVRDTEERPAASGVDKDAGALPPDVYGTARRVPVKLGLMRGEEVEVFLAGEGEDGLRPGDLLVVNGQRNLDDGTRVRVRRQLGSIKELDR